MSLSRHSLCVARDILQVLDQRPRNKDVQLAKIIQNSIENWVMRLSGNKMHYPKMKVGLLGVDGDSLEILLQAGMDVLHIVGQSNWKWFFSEDKPDIDLLSQFDPLVPYYPAFCLDCKERKHIYEANESDLLLGNPLFHPSAVRSGDCLVGIGSYIGPLSYLAPGVGAGKMVTVGAHVVVASDVEIGDFSHVENNVSISSGVRIGEGCRIGAGCILFPGVSIAPFTILNAGQIVKFSIK